MAEIIVWSEIIPDHGFLPLETRFQIIFHRDRSIALDSPQQLEFNPYSKTTKYCAYLLEVDQKIFERLHRLQDTYFSAKESLGQNCISCSFILKRWEYNLNTALEFNQISPRYTPLLSDEQQNNNAFLIHRGQQASLNKDYQDVLTRFVQNKVKEMEDIGISVWPNESTVYLQPKTVKSISSFDYIKMGFWLTVTLIGAIIGIPLMIMGALRRRKENKEFAPILTAYNSPKLERHCSDNEEQSEDDQSLISKRSKSYDLDSQFNKEEPSKTYRGRGEHYAQKFLKTGDLRDKYFAIRFFQEAADKDGNDDRKAQGLQIINEQADDFSNQHSELEIETLENSFQTKVLKLG